MLKPKSPLPLKEHEQVEIDVRQGTPPGEADATWRKVIGNSCYAVI